MAPQLHILSNTVCSRSRTESVLMSCVEAERIAMHITLADYNAKVLLQQRLVEGDITQEECDAETSLHCRLVLYVSHYSHRYLINPNSDIF